ncbi:MAG: hypothetical protein GYA38_10100 [Chloroflexi bacterium]|nr:hypothetical protein [Chloroflexota bacterium]
MKDINPELVAAASEVLSSGSCKVFKSTRAGFTTSAVLAAMEAGKTILVLSPTSKILSETVMKASKGRAIIVPANSFCPILQEQVQQDHFLAKIPLPLPDCQECPSMGKCPVTEILEADKPPVISLTYAKINALMLAKSEIARQIKHKLAQVDVVLLDEAHTVSLPPAARLQAFYCVPIPEGYPMLTEICQSWVDFCNDNLETLTALKAEGDAGYVGKHLSKLVSIKAELGFKRLSAAWNELFSLAQRRDELSLRDDEILAIRDIVSIMGGYWAAISYVRENEGTEGMTYISGNVGALHRCLRDFLTMYVPNADHIYSSATLIEPSSEFFEGLSGKLVKEVVFPDLRNTNAKMSIYPDRWRLNSRNFARSLDRIVARIVEICKEEAAVYILAPNMRKAGVIERKLHEVLGAAAPKVDFYRSDMTMGVARDDRVCIAIGLAEIPSNACDHLAWGNDSEARWLHSQSLRTQNVQAASWQAWSRVKDPKGEVESKVYCIGIRAEQVADVVTWGSGRRLELLEIHENKLPGGSAARTPKFKVQVNTLIEPPRVFAEDRTASHKERHSVGEYIAGIEGCEDIIALKRGKVDIENILNRATEYQGEGESAQNAYTNSYRQNGQFLPNYVKVWQGDQEQLALFLGIYFVNRSDCYAKQYWDVRHEKWSYYKEVKSLDDINLDAIKQHVRGQLMPQGYRFCIAVYQIDRDDRVSWICYDLDNHDNSNPEVQEDVKRLLAVLDSYSIPYLLEASGSEDSYHVWVFLVPTRTYNAFKFSRQIAAEAGIKCEIWPKQQSINSDKAEFGNPVKLPLCFHNKTGRRSGFLDPQTFKPLEYVPLPGLVRLFEIPEPLRKPAQKPVRAPISDNGSAPGPSGFHPCLQHLIDSRVQLSGGSGHAARTAIAIDACNSGLSKEAAIDLFRHQDDFKLEYTTYQIESIYSKSLKPFSCSTLLDKCGDLVRCYCETCPRGKHIRYGSEVSA